MYLGVDVYVGYEINMHVHEALHVLCKSTEVLIALVHFACFSKTFDLMEFFDTSVCYNFK